jgi:hypothetical protein
MAEVPIQKTPTSAGDVTTAIGQVYASLEGQNPSRDTLAILLGQWDLETGAGGSTFNFNVGNLKVTPEQEAAGINYFVQPAVTSQSNHFRAYNSLLDGVNSWLSLLAKTSRYTATWTHAKMGDAVGFSQAIEASGYGGDPATLNGKYANAVLLRIQKYQKKLPGAGPATPSNGAFLWGAIAAGILGASLFLGLGKRPALGRKLRLA